MIFVAESYPNLKSSPLFQDLMVSLEGSENRITVERRRFNEALAAYNSQIRQFPDSLVASMSGHQLREDYFKADPAAHTAPTVSF